MEIVIGAIALVLVIIIGVGALYVVDTMGFEAIIILCILILMSYALGRVILNI